MEIHKVTNIKLLHLRFVLPLHVCAYDKVFRCCAMDKFSMAMGITFLNRATFFAITLAQVVGESKSTT